MYNLQRIRYVTSHYQEIQGLRIVPLGAWLILLAIAEANRSVLPPAPQVAMVIMVFYLLAGFFVLLFYRIIGAFYERRFGSVNPLLQSKSRAFSGCLRGGGFLFVLYVGLTASNPQLPYVVTLLLMLFLISVAWRSGWYRKDYVVLVAFLVSIYSIPGSVTTMLLNGCTVILGGLLDHFLLVRTLKHTPEEGHARSI